MIRRPPKSTPCPYTPLFRSSVRGPGHRADQDPARPGRRPPPPQPGVRARCRGPAATPVAQRPTGAGQSARPAPARSEEHTSELQSRQYLVCRLLLEKKKIHQSHISFFVTLISTFLFINNNVYI